MRPTILAGILALCAIAQTPTDLRLRAVTDLAKQSGQKVSKLFVHSLAVTDEAVFIAYSTLLQSGEGVFRVADTTDPANIRIVLSDNSVPSYAFITASKKGELLLIRGEALGSPVRKQQRIHVIPANHQLVPISWNQENIVTSAASPTGGWYLIDRMLNVYSTDERMKQVTRTCAGAALPHNYPVPAIGATPDHLYLVDGPAPSILDLDMRTCRATPRDLSTAVDPIQRATYANAAQKNMSGDVRRRMIPNFISAGARHSTGRTLLLLSGFPAARGAVMLEIDGRSGRPVQFVAQTADHIPKGPSGYPTSICKFVGMRNRTIYLATVSGIVLAFDRAGR